MRIKEVRIIFGLIILQLLYFIAPQAIFCQTEKIDIIEYTPPKGWNKTPKDGLIVYSDLDKNTGGYCLLTVYPSTASVGSPQRDFVSAWTERVVNPFKADANPKTETQNDDGWTSVSAATQIQSDGITSAVMMTVISGYGRTASILAILNNQQYLPQIEAFVSGIKMNKAQAMVDAKPPPTNNPVVGSSSNSIVGKWGEGTSGGAIGYGTNASQKQYTFNADGTYEFAYSGWSGTVGYAGAFHIQVRESGIYKINGDLITITPQRSSKESNSDVRPNPLEIVTYKWLVRYYEGSHDTCLVLHPDHKTVRDGEFAYLGDYPNSYCYSPIKK